jgi:hypothetical protein
MDSIYDTYEDIQGILIDVRLYHHLKVRQLFFCW